MKDNNITYFCYKKDNINKLTFNILNEFIFVIHHFWFFFPAENFFQQENNLCEKDYYIFLIQFINDENTEIILGKNFYRDTQFTLEHEENEIYFYSKYIEYFSGEIKVIIDKNSSTIISLLNSSIIVIGISLFINIVSFMVYFYIKRKKEILKLKEY